ncbi:hypothetical protein Tco_0799051 [Tanacetum coccineum]
MTSDPNSSELRIHDQNNEQSSSKLVPKVVPSADKTATLRQELELLFHHHITMLRLQLGPQRKESLSSKVTYPHNEKSNFLGLEQFIQDIQSFELKKDKRTETYNNAYP